MDTETEAHSYEAMDHRDANQSLARRFFELGGGKGLTLDIGTGPGDIPILMAQQHQEGRYVAVDAAWEMLRLAKAKVTRNNLTKRIVLHRADVLRSHGAQRGDQPPAPVEGARRDCRQAQPLAGGHGVMPRVSCRARWPRG